jgi:hypothetical protein
MKKDTVIGLKKPEVQAEDPLTEVLRRGSCSSARQERPRIVGLDNQSTERLVVRGA